MDDHALGSSADVLRVPQYKVGTLRYFFASSLGFDKELAKYYISPSVGFKALRILSREHGRQRNDP